MKFIIIGDSWGYGEYAPESREKKTSIITHGGVAQHLQEAGHMVKNLSCPGDNNTRQLRLLTNELEQNKYDQIIWFQTEPLRNLFEYGPFWEPQDCWDYDVSHCDKANYDSYDVVLTDLFRKTYDIAQKIHDKHRIPFFVVGGMSPVHESISEYEFFNGKIWSWGKDLTGLYHPHNSYYHTGKFVGLHVDKLHDQRMVEEFSAARAYEDSQETSPFFQASHPTRQAHLDLTNRILSKIGK